MQTARPLILYNLFPLLAGPFTTWDSHLRRAADMGFNGVFLNPIQQAGLSGSLYAVKDFFTFDDRLVDRTSDTTAREQVQDMIQSARQYGLRVVADLVVNHCSIDSDLLLSHPDWFVWDSPGKVAHPFCMQNGRKVQWGDLAKLDHLASRDQEGLYQFFFGVVRFLLDLGVRGFRCDAAYQVPARFWRRLIESTKKIQPDTVYLAETLGCPPDQTKSTAQAGFDYVFNSSKWWDFDSPWLMEQYRLTSPIAPSIGFPESHDTVRLFQESGGNIHAMKQRYLFAALFSGGVMMPLGFEFGFTKKPHVVSMTAADWEQPAIDLQDFVREVNAIKSAHELFHADCPTEMRDASQGRVLLMSKTLASSSQRALVILNKDVRHRQLLSGERISRLLGKGSAIRDVSPGPRHKPVPDPLTAELQPGQGIVLVTT